jgi:hypothetical protein
MVCPDPHCAQVLTWAYQVGPTPSRLAGHPGMLNTEVRVLVVRRVASMRRPSSSLIERTALQVSAGFFMGDLIPPTANSRSSSLRCDRPAPGDSSREHHADERGHGDQFPTGSGLARLVACWINYARSISPANRRSAKEGAGAAVEPSVFLTLRFQRAPVVFSTCGLNQES